MVNAMHRSSAQALFKYLPECVIEGGGGITVTKVKRWKGLPYIPSGMARILEEIKNVARPVALGGAYLDVDRRFPDVYLEKNFEFYKPDYIELELFPLTFYDRRTNLYKEFREVVEIKNFFRRLNPAERKNWVQEDLLYLNPKTSAVKSFHVVPCKNHPDQESVMLDKNGKKSQRDWRWRCIICNSEQVVAGYVDNDYITPATPVRSPIVFQPQILSIVNVRDYSKAKVGKNDANLIVLAKYLNKVKDPLEVVFNDVAMDKKSGLTNRVKDSSIDAYRKTQKFTEEQLKIISEELDKAISKESSGLDNALSDTQKQLGSVNMQQIAPRVYEYIETVAERTKTTLDDVKKTDTELSSQIDMFKEKLSNIGVAESCALEKVPIIQVAYGYTRGDLNTSKCMLKAFPNEKSHDKIQLYANDIETEALLFTINRSKIGRWLKANGILDEWELKSEEEEKVWFLNNVDTSIITRFEGVKDSGTLQSRITEAVFTLLHTMSHALIKQVPSHSGISTSSLGEIIFPNIPAILIYSNSQGGFNIGELHELYINRTYPWIDNIKLESRNGGCVYDPICFEQDSACHYCMFLHEVSCSHFNKALHRDYLFSGGKQNIKFGFWDFEMK
jgi:hypothetical protein